MPRPPLKPEERSDVFRGLANGLRRRLVDHLRSGPASFDDLQRLAPVAQGTLSNHLTVLRECGLIESRVGDGQMVYRLRPQVLKRATKWLALPVAK